MRGAPYGIGDGIVPGYSQDMNNVPRLRGKRRDLMSGVRRRTPEPAGRPGAGADRLRSAQAPGAVPAGEHVRRVPT
ncbi:MAG: hypothetical protein MZW92_14860 [Comamonadaceae bacterium]|nr:hypothetical protein [Comamonadaceae bacterium]